MLQHFVRLSVWLLMTVPCLLVAACSQHRMMSGDAREVDAVLFEKMYDAERTTLAHADYLGKRGGYHYMAIYDPEWGSTPKYRFSVRTPVNTLPPPFPDRPQKQLKSLSEVAASKPSQ